MDTEVPYMPSVGNLHKILDSIQKAGAPEAFGLDFLRDLGFTSSNDRAVIKLLKFLGLLDTAGKPLPAYREFMDSSRAKSVLGTRMRAAYDDLFLSDKEAQNQGTAKLKGWFRTKTGASDAVAEKMASTFKALASYATFDGIPAVQITPPAAEVPARPEEDLPVPPSGNERDRKVPTLGFSYRIEVHLPDTTSIDTYRAIFRAIREELS